MASDDDAAYNDSINADGAAVCLCGHRLRTSVSSGEEAWGTDSLFSLSVSDSGKNDGSRANRSVLLTPKKKEEEEEKEMLPRPGSNASDGVGEDPFVYLSPPNNTIRAPSVLLSMNQDDNDSNDAVPHSAGVKTNQVMVGNHHDGFLHTWNHEIQLSRMALTRQEVKEDSSDGFVCHLCLERLEDAMQSNIQRLQSERKSYVDAVALEAERDRGIQRALTMNVGILQGGENRNEEHFAHYSDVVGEELLSSTLEAYRRDVHSLSAAVEDFEEELRHLHELWEEQTKRSADLHRTRHAIMVERNALEIQARTFDGVIRHLTSQAHEAHLQVTQLEKVELLRELFPIVVSEPRQRRRQAAPATIHGLRLWHCPTPAAQGNLTWEEIGAAWSQACQALLFASAVTQFQSEEFRLVPTAACAKIIQLMPVSSQNAAPQEAGAQEWKQKKRVHHLGMDLEYDTTTTTRTSERQDSMPLAIGAFYSYLYELIHHVTASMADSAEERRSLVPMADRSTIGRIHLPTLVLSNVQDGDDEWWEAIHGMMTNVLWLLQRLPNYGKI